MAEFDISAGSVQARISDVGAELVSVLAPDRHGVDAELIRRGTPYAGAICGRFANRISGAKFDLDGVSYQLQPNEGANQLHGGHSGFDKKNWDAAPYTTQERSGVVMRVVSDDGDEGYPGELTVSVDYWVSDTNTLGIDFEATTDAPTVLNLTNHAYWNLGGDDSSDIRTHELQLWASSYVQVDQELIPTGEMADVAGSKFDLTTSQMLTNSYDHCFVLDDPPDEHGLSTAAVLAHPNSGRSMRVLTNHPGLQVYTADHMDHFGLALEAQGFPDAPNQPDFPSAVLRPGEIYRRATRLRFSAE